MFAAIDFGIASPSLLHIPASLLEHIGCVEPAFEMPAAELAFLILFVASPLPRLLDFDLVPGELRRSLCPRGYGSASGQRIYPRRCGPYAARFSYELFNSTRSLLRDARFAGGAGRRTLWREATAESAPALSSPQELERQGQSTLASEPRHSEIPSYLPEAATDEQENAGKTASHDSCLQD